MAKAKKLPSGNWRVLLYVGTDAAGKRMYESFTAETKSEAEFLAAEYKLKHPKEKRSRITLGEAFDSYIESKSAVLSPSTLRSYKTIRKKHLQKLMPLDVNTLTNADIQREINGVAASHSPKTVRNVNALLSAVLTMFRPDFTLSTTLPAKQKKDFYIPTEETICKLLHLADGTNIELPLLLASQLGLRASEINGLTHGCIDRERNEITIKQAYVRGEDGNVIKSPKSYAGYRTIPCSETIIQKIGEGKPDDLIYPSTSEQISNRWQRFLEKNEEKHFNFHALRHYFASRALLLGIPQKYIAELMGHSSEHMINTVYQHTFKDTKRTFAEQLVRESDKTLEKVANATRDTTQN